MTFDAEMEKSIDSDQENKYESNLKKNVGKLVKGSTHLICTDAFRKKNLERQVKRIVQTTSIDGL